MSGFSHKPVLVDAVCEALNVPFRTFGGQPSDGIFVDLTCGGAGHTRALLQSVQPTKVVLFDRDPDALAAARARLHDAPCELIFVHAPFSRFTEELDRLGIGRVHGILADLGVSSHQLDTGPRGFSFRHEGPLDMRMDPTRGQPLSSMLARMTADELTRILREYGEEPDARRIAAAIIRERPGSTTELANTVTEAMSARQRRQLGVRIHPATKTFQALRIMINGEFDELMTMLHDAPNRLSAGGRLAIISFHSLEDRRVKRVFRDLSEHPPLPHGIPIPDHERPRASFRPVHAFRRGRMADDTERDANPRSRSARLRVLERI